MSDATLPPGGMLLVTIDRLPAWIMPAHGCTWVAAPTLAALAGRGLVCDRLIAGGDDAHATLATLAGRTSMTGDGWPLLTTAGRLGWAPTVVTDDETLATSLPADQPVSLVANASTPRVARAVHETNLGRLFTAAADLVGAGTRRFLWCHAASLGAAWDAPPNLRAAYVDPDDPPPPAGAAVPDIALEEGADPDLIAGLRHVFAGHLTLLDGCLATLLDAVSSAEHGRAWTVLVAGVRGVGLGLHGRIGCGPLPPYSELVQLPAIVVDHRGRMAAQRYGGLLVPADLAATLLAQAGDAATAAADDDARRGRPLEDLLDTWQRRERDRAVCVARHGTAVATPAWHLVLPTIDDETAVPLLYAKPDDYFEACDVADRCPEVAAELAAVARLAADDPAQAWTRPLSEVATHGVW